jgi:pimeloyl-ACP methyl ester carboxylesterase
MDFEHVTFDLPHGTFHALQGGDPDGQPTIVLHGFPDHPPTAKPFLAELGRRGRHVVAPWLRGYAPSPTAGPFDFAALTSDVLALIDRWSPGRAVELVGHDWGALITYDACVTAPERIERAVTLAVPHPLTFLSQLTRPSLKGCDLPDGGVFQLARGNALPEIPDALLSDVDECALPLWDGIGDGIVACASPPGGDQIHFVLRLGAFRNRARKDRRKEWATRNILNGRVAEQEFAKVRL